MVNPEKGIVLKHNLKNIITKHGQPTVTKVSIPEQAVPIPASVPEKKEETIVPEEKSGNWWNIFN
ncbi:hypothetical protein D3C85_1856180 [compost metagenome]